MKLTREVTNKGINSPLNNVEVVTYVVAILDGLESLVHLEHIAIKAHELTPGAFRWDLDEFANYVDKDKVRVSLTDAEKPAKGRLVQGVGTTSHIQQTKRTDYWRLTAAGSEWLAANAERIAASFTNAAPSIKKGRAKQIKHQIIKSRLYQQYSINQSVENRPFDFTDLLKCSPDASLEVIRDRFDALRGQVIRLNDPDLIDFMDACAATYTQMLEG